MGKNIMWFSILFIVLISLFFVCAGFVMAVNVSTGPVSEVSKPIVQQDLQNSGNSFNDPKTVNVLILGDSIAKGTGDETFRGIGGYLTDNLKNYTAKDITVSNLGIDGLKSGELLEQVKSGSLNNEIASSDIILISIGGNDLLEIRRQTGSNLENAFKEKQSAYIAALKEITKKVREVNKDAFVVFVGLYNPYDDQGVNDYAQFMSDWNHATSLIFIDDIKAVFVPTYDMFKLNMDRYIAPDNLHPNSTGYQMIAQLISRSLEDVVVNM
ncbi:MAG TPA: GDSL-type esterase/lipase family protein [Pseudobacteroides sp.]|nr:GDSL-type esterase/lipase family protein [Pseudobacteroides sp.]